MPGHYGKPTFIIMKKQMLDGYMPDFGGPDYYRMKKSMHDEYMEEESEAKLEADPKHKGTIKKLNEVVEGLRKASKLHGEQADTLEGLAQTLSRSSED
tara:strand:+ start:279 stop:572 length:294 start_codon:yes stop_codon:yes gene_type:complete